VFSGVFLLILSQIQFFLRKSSMWEISKHQGRLQTESLSASIDLCQPGLGLNKLTLQGTPLEQANLLGVLFSSSRTEKNLPIVENYVRGRDLFVRYDKTENQPLESTIYWRTISPAGVNGIEMVVSTQTDLLDCEMAIQTSLCLPAEQVLRLTSYESQPTFVEIPHSSKTYQADSNDGTGLFLFRLSDRPMSYVQMVHPSDFQTADLNFGEAGTNLISHSNTLFGGLHLEKGVIRRGRLRGYFFDRENDEAVAKECYQQFVESVPPLTV